MHKIIHVGYFHRFDDGRIVRKECAALKDYFGADVTYITSDRNGDTKFSQLENVKICVIPIVDKRFIRFFKYLIDVQRKIVNENPDVCHIHEFILLPLVTKLKKKKIKVIIDLHENDLMDRSEQIKNKYGLFIGKIFYKFLCRYEKRVVKHSDGIISVTPQIINRIERYGVTTALISNYPKLDEVPFIREYEEYSPFSRTVCFAGGISDLWNHKNVLSAIEKVDYCKYLLAGRSDSEYLQELQQQKGWDATEYLGVISHSEVINKIYFKSGIGLALMEYDKGWIGKDGTLGNTKLFEFMQAGLPVVCTDFKIWEDIIKKYKCGILVNPNSVIEIVKAIEWLQDNTKEAYKMGRNGHVAIVEEYNWEHEKKKLFKLYEKILKK
ncbi:MAG: glycosyltransferase family 4 protein [Clostridiales bacterium]|nr:glycosyltransferase family 4 protein [Clostridiales bacterium]